jgi:hypothetical protein
MKTAHQQTTADHLSGWFHGGPAANLQASHPTDSRLQLFTASHLHALFAFSVLNVVRSPVTINTVNITLAGSSPSSKTQNQTSIPIPINSDNGSKTDLGILVFTSETPIMIATNTIPRIISIFYLLVIPHHLTIHLLTCTRLYGIHLVIESLSAHEGIVVTRLNNLTLVEHNNLVGQ